MERLYRRRFRTLRRTVDISIVGVLKNAPGGDSRIYPLVYVYILINPPRHVLKVFEFVHICTFTTRRYYPITLWKHVRQQLYRSLVRAINFTINRQNRRKLIVNNKPISLRDSIKYRWKCDRSETLTKIAFYSRIINSIRRNYRTILTQQDLHITILISVRTYVSFRTRFHILIRPRPWIPLHPYVQYSTKRFIIKT